MAAQTKQQRLQRLITNRATEAVRAQVVPAVKSLQKPSFDLAGVLSKFGENDMKGTTKTKADAALGMIRAMALGKGDPRQAFQFAHSAYGGDSAVTKQMHKAMAVGDMTAGGFLVPEDFSAEVIELLEPLSVVRALQPRSVRLPRGNKTFPKLTGSASAAYIAENTDIAISEPTLGEEVMDAKKLTSLVVLSNELLRFSNEVAHSEIQSHLLDVMAREEDTNLLRGDGTGSGPKGILNRIAAGNVLSSNGTTATNIEDDFRDLINALESNDMRMTRPSWLMHPTQKNALFNLRDANGNLIFPEIRNGPSIYGIPVRTSTQIPNTELYLVEGTEVVLGEVTGMEIVTSGEASYLQNSALVSAFSRDQSVIRVITMHDIMLRHDVGAAVINDVAW